MVTSTRRRFLTAALITLVVVGSLIAGILFAASQRPTDSPPNPSPSSALPATSNPPQAPSEAVPSADDPPTSEPAPEMGAPGGPGLAGCEAAPLASPANPNYEAAVSQVAAELGKPVSVSWFDPARGIVTVGTLGPAPAWSTAKAPLAVAAAQSGNGATYDQAIASALQTSDNAAAEQLWQSLGADDNTRAQAVTGVLRQAGDQVTTVPDAQLYPPHSVYGQTAWGTADQVLFGYALPCLGGGEQVIGNMASVTASQRWGLGRQPEAVFKGGWGPTPDGGYTVRQFGWYTDPQGHRVLVAIAVQAQTFESGIAALDALSASLAG